MTEYPQKKTVTPSGVRLEDMTAEDIAAREAAVISAQTEAAATAQKATDKTAGNQKLLDLGLTQAEVDALTQ